MSDIWNRIIDFSLLSFKKYLSERMFVHKNDMRKQINPEQRLTRFISFRISENDLKKLKERIGYEPGQKGNFFRKVVNRIIQPHESN